MKTMQNEIIGEIQTQTIQEILQHLVNHLIINGSLLNLHGLHYGKMGIALFFFHYSRYTCNPLFNEFGLYLISLVKPHLNEDLSLDYEKGLAGIGTGFEYLAQQNFLQKDKDLMSDIDNRIINAISYEVKFKILNGFGRYLLLRNNGNLKKEKSQSIAIKKALIAIVDKLITNYKNNDILSDSITLLYNIFLSGFEERRLKHFFFEIEPELIKEINEKPFSQNLFSLIDISQVSSNPKSHTTSLFALDYIFEQPDCEFYGIKEFLWLLQCEKRIVENGGYESIIPNVRTKINKVAGFYNLIYLDKMFENNMAFSLQGGYAGFALAFLSKISVNDASWINLL